MVDEALDNKQLSQLDEATPLPPVPKDISTIINLLNISPAEAQYLEASYLDEIARGGHEQKTTIKNLIAKTTGVRKYIMAEGNRREPRRREPYTELHPMVTDRMSGLQLAFAEMRHFFGDQELRKQPGFLETMQEFSKGEIGVGSPRGGPMNLVDRLTFAVRDIRSRSEYTMVR